MTPIPTIYQLTHVGTAPKFNEAFATGCPGAIIVREGNGPPLQLRPGPIALWGEHKFYKTLHEGIAEGRTWYYGDHAYFGRGQFFRITKNALQVHGGYFESGPNFDAAMARLAEVRKTVPVVVEPTKPRGDFIMVCPPSEPLSERSGFLKDDWTRIVTARLAKLTKRPVVIRDKPKINRTPAPLLEALVGAHMLITYTSNAAIEAVMAGYPALCTGPNPVTVVSGNSFERLEKPFVANEDARTAWAANLCANQWSLAEIAAGKAWEALNK